jgi:arylsulfatase
VHARPSFVLTERYVRDHGVFENAWDAPTSFPTFLHSLRAVGYHTACIGKMHLWVHGGRGPEGRTADTRQRSHQMNLYGFDEPIETVGELASIHITTEYSDHLAAKGLLATYRSFVDRRNYTGGDGVERLPNRLPGRSPCLRRITSMPGTETRVVRWIDEYDGERPWLLWVGFPGPHDPWDAPIEYVDLYRDASMPAPMTTERPEIPATGPFRNFISYFLWTHSASSTLSDERIEDIRRHYYADITVIDEAVGKIRQALERSGMAENTWIIYTSDHGEMMGDHRMIMKMVFYDQATRVPVIIRPPGGTDRTVIDTLAEHMDVTATIRGIAGGATHETFEGRDLLAGAEPDSDPVAFSENYGFGMVRTPSHKLVFHEDSLEPAQLFDLAEDPTEDHNLVEDPAARDVLDELMEIRVRHFLADGRVKPGPGVFELAEWRG